MRKNVSKILNLLKRGLIISMISDAGTPSISDPGITLINECINNNIGSIPLPGPSSVLTAVSISGFSEKFFFYGFSRKKKNFRGRSSKFIFAQFFDCIFCFTKKIQIIQA